MAEHAPGAAAAAATAAGSISSGAGPEIKRHQGPPGAGPSGGPQALLMGAAGPHRCQGPEALLKGGPSRYRSRPLGPCGARGFARFSHPAPSAHSSAERANEAAAAKVGDGVGYVAL